MFPYAPERNYTPCDAPKAKLFALRDFLGFERNVIVQATCHGNDNRALVDALQQLRRAWRAAWPRSARDVTDAELRALHAAGVRGVRFNFVKRLVDFTPREVLAEIAERIAPLGWHVVVYFEAAGPARAVGLLHLAADHGRRRPHGAARREPSRSMARSSSCSCA